MQPSIIFTTYNSPVWLEKVLWGFSQQTFTEFEIIIADDGSTAATKALIERFQQSSSLAIAHVWHEDLGFRKCGILNKAILQARGDYLIFTDGDCIPRRDFVATHVAEAEPHTFLSGSYFKLPMATSQAITHDDIVSGRCFEKSWLYQHGLPRRRKTLKISAGPKLAALLNRFTTTACNLKGSNASAWKADVLAVNGFDERMPWGGEDREFGVRLINSGVKAKHVRYNAVVLHLDHSRSYVDPEHVSNNKKLRLYNQKHKVQWTDFGITRHLDLLAKSEF
jgi:glycosyltransferase involved in cell wall biosynthesis